MNETILIVEDNGDVAEVIKLILAMDEYSAIVETCSDGLNRLRSGTEVRAIILDVSMPGSACREFIEHLRRDPEFAWIPFIALTTPKVEAVIVDDLSAYAVLMKPFSAEDLLKVIGRAIRLEPGKA